MQAKQLRNHQFKQMQFRQSQVRSTSARKTKTLVEQNSQSILQKARDLVMKNRTKDSKRTLTPLDSRNFESTDELTIADQPYGDMK